MQVLAQRMKHLGMVSLKESSKRDAIALLLHMQVDAQQKPEPSSKMVKSLVNDFADLSRECLLHQVHLQACQHIHQIPLLCQQSFA